MMEEKFRLIKSKTEEIENQTADVADKIIYVSLINLAFLLDIIIVDSLKFRGVLKETDLEPFPKNLRGVVVSMNHQDGNEWIFVYRRCFKPIYFIAPWLVLKDLPRTWADRNNFLSSSLTKLVSKIMIPVDRNEDGSADVPFGESLEAAQSVGLVGFFEGHRTRKCPNLRYSKNGKALGELSESLGIFAKKGMRIKAVWAEYKDTSLSSLPEDGIWRLRRFFSWYWRTLWKKNGEIHIVWGETRKFENVEEKNSKELRKIATLQFENYMLELADQT